MTTHARLLECIRNPVICISFFILFYSGAGKTGERTVFFTGTESAYQVDYHSFYPALLLQHKIGPFRKLPKNPVLVPGRGRWDAKDAADPWVLVTADSIYLFYDGNNDDHYRIGYAVRDSTGWFWQKRGKIPIRFEADWNFYHQISPAFFFTGRLWQMLYSGNYRDSELGYRLGVVTPGLERPWAAPAIQPLFPADSGNWDFAGTAYPDVVYLPEQHTFRMWYTGFSGPLAAIGLASSPDGIHWQKEGTGPVLTIPPGVIAPEVVYNGRKYSMYFARLSFRNGMQTRICRAESEDGVNWTNIQDVLRPEARWEGNRLMRPNISYFEGRMHLFYCAQKGSQWRIGEAVAEATFVSSGRWVSPPISTSVSAISLTCELPLRTSVRLFLWDASAKEKLLVNPEMPAVEIRPDVYRMIYRNLPMERINPIQIELELRTEDPARSPVIYQIKLID